MADTMRWVGDTDALKFSLMDDGVVRTDLASATSLTMLAKNAQTPGDNFSGACTVITPPEVDGANQWNCQFQLVTGDTAAPGEFNLYVTVHEPDGTTIATYGVSTLEIRAIT